MSTSIPASIVLTFLLAGCSSQRPAEGAAPAAPSPAAAPAAAPQRQAGAPLAFETPPGWVAEEPGSEMRKAQYRVPSAQDGVEDATCVVYYFGAGGGGGVDANVERWCSQFEQPDGRASKDVVVRSERQVSGMPVHDVELGGTFVAETAPGSGERVNEPNYRMLASIVESDHGAYYVKLVGPEATVQAHASAFRGFVAGVR